MKEKPTGVRITTTGDAFFIHGTSLSGQEGRHTAIRGTKKVVKITNPETLGKYIFDLLELDYTGKPK